MISLIVVNFDSSGLDCVHKLQLSVKIKTAINQHYPLANRSFFVALLVFDHAVLCVYTLTFQLDTYQSRHCAGRDTAGLVQPDGPDSTETPWPVWPFDQSPSKCP